MEDSPQKNLSEKDRLRKAREDRIAQALRDNLRRRKQAVRKTKSTPKSNP